MERHIVIEINVETFELRAQPDVSLGTQQATALSLERRHSNTVLLFVSWNHDLLRLSCSFFFSFFCPNPEWDAWDLQHFWAWVMLYISVEAFWKPWGA